MKHKELIEEPVVQNSVETSVGETIRAADKSLTTDDLVVMVEQVKLKLSNTMVYQENIREELKAYTFVRPREDSKELGVLKEAYDGLLKNGNHEKFYSKYYSQIPLHAVKYFPGLSRNAATLLCTKLADRMVSFSREKLLSTVKGNQVKLSLPEKELAGLQYLEGYVLHNLHNKIAKSKKSELSESQQAMSFLKAGKAVNQTEKISLTLTASLDRGGLWTISGDAQKIFLRTEHYFRVNTSNTGLQSINIAEIVDKCFHDEEILSSCNSLLYNSQLKVDKKVVKDVLHSILGLYLRVLSFSFAKDIIQKHEIKTKQNKAKGLRKEIKRSTQEQDMPRGP